MSVSKSKKRISVKGKREKSSVSDSTSPPTDVGGPIALPALRGVMGDWTYYTASMRLVEVATRVRLAQDIHHSRTLSTMIQRAVSNRSAEIAEYLRNQKSERFFNSLVIGVYKGDPEWHDIDIKSNPYLDDQEVERLDGQIGAFVLNGSEQLYAIDGQHRVVGIQRALKDDASIGADNISVTFVPYDTGTTQGLLRTRRLFTTLNRYAKPVSQRDRIALDEDDAMAIVTRRLIEDYPLFQNEKTSASRAKSLSPSDKVAVTTVAVLYDVLDLYFRKTQTKWTKYKRVRPPDKDIQQYYQLAVELWDSIRSAFPELDEVAQSEPEDEIAGKYRTREGGNLVFRPVGFRALVRAIQQFKQMGLSTDAAARRLAAAPLTLGGAPWAGILYDPTTKRMLTTKENQEAALALWFFMAGGSLQAIGLDEDGLRNMIAGLTAREPSDVQLPVPAALDAGGVGSGDSGAKRRSSGRTRRNR